MLNLPIKTLTFDLLKVKYFTKEIILMRNIFLKESLLKWSLINRHRGFTLVEIMIVVAIIALLAAIAIPNLLRARRSANDALAQGTLRTLSTASEIYATVNLGSYPLQITSLTNSTPPFMSRNYCTSTFSGFTYNCSGFAVGGYTITATPTSVGTSGTTVYTIATGGILTP